MSEFEVIAYGVLILVITLRIYTHLFRRVDSAAACCDRYRVPQAGRLVIGALRGPIWGHVWTAPALQEEFDIAAMVGCGHVFGLLLQPLWPLAMM